jgi:hypothetical protein
MHVQITRGWHMLKLRDRIKNNFPDSRMESNRIENILKRRELLITSKAIRGIVLEHICNMFSYRDNANHQTWSNRRELRLDKPMQ